MRCKTIVTITSGLVAGCVTCDTCDMCNMCDTCDSVVGHRRGGMGWCLGTGVDQWARFNKNRIIRT